MRFDSAIATAFVGAFLMLPRLLTVPARSAEVCAPPATFWLYRVYRLDVSGDIIEPVDIDHPYWKAFSDLRISADYGDHLSLEATVDGTPTVRLALDAACEPATQVEDVPPRGCDPTCENLPVRDPDSCEWAVTWAVTGEDGTELPAMWRFVDPSLALESATVAVAEFGDGEGNRYEAVWFGINNRIFAPYFPEPEPPPDHGCGEVWSGDG